MVLLKIAAVLLGIFLSYVFFLFICSLLINPKREYESNSCFYRFLLYSASAAVLKVLRVRVYVTGIEKIPVDQKPLFVGDHRSNFDPIIEWMVLRKWELAFISKQSNFKIPFFGRFIRKCCFLSIDRQDPKKAIVTINKAAKLLTNGEVSVAVYPEGTRNKCSELLPFHNGVFKIAKKAERPIVVMAISGTEQIAKNVLRRRTEVYLDIAEVIPAEEVVGLRPNAIGERVRAALEKKTSVRDSEALQNEQSVACY